MIDKIRKTLDTYNDLIEELEEKRLSKFNMFYVLNLQSYEVRHSSFLAWLLNGNAPHGFHNEIIRRIFEVCYPGNSINWDKSISVKTELPIRNEEPEENKNTNAEKRRKSSRRIDIFLENDEFTCTIENKYGSKLHNKQCPYYKTWVANNHAKKDNKFILLDRPVTKPKELDNDPNYDSAFVYCSYKTILDILNDLLPTIKVNTDVYYSIKSYIDVLDNYYNPKIEVSDLLKKVKIEDRNFLVAYQDDITNKYKNSFTSSQIGFIDDLVAYHDQLKIENDDVVYSIMEEALKVEEGVKINGGYGHSKSDSKRYGYALILFNEDCKKSLSVDYPVAGGKRIICGLGRCSNNRAKELIKFLIEHPNTIKTLEDNGWSANWSIQLRSTSHQSNWEGISLDALCDKEVVPSEDLELLNLSLIKKDDNTKKEKLKAVKDYISDEDFLSLQKAHVDGVVDSKTSRDEIIDKMDVKKLGHINFKLDMIYHIPEGKSKEELRDIYTEKTQEIMKMFNPEIDLNKYFKPEYIKM